MSDAEIEAFAARLEAEVHVGDAKFRLDEIWDENDAMANHIIANREGFLHLAALLLRGAAMEENSVSPLIALENKNAEAFFDKVERREQWEVSAPETTRPVPRWRDTLTTWVCVWLFFAVIAVFIVGLVTVFESIF